ncbi:MAG TPA: hypothetical protein DCO79_15650 [Spirochaeta sp.]|nr:hypothetical protein [Spirochaeta sp.]
MKDELLQKAKIEAAKNRISLTAFIEEAVEQKLQSDNSPPESVNDFKIITFGSGGVNAGVDLNNGESLLDLMEN